MTYKNKDRPFTFFFQKMSLEEAHEINEEWNELSSYSKFLLILHCVSHVPAVILFFVCFIVISFKDFTPTLSNPVYDPKIAWIMPYLIGPFTASLIMMPLLLAYGYLFAALNSILPGLDSIAGFIASGVFIFVIYAIVTL